MSRIRWPRTYMHTFLFEGMGIPFGPVVSDLCAPITQVSRRVITKKTVGSCGFAQREPHQSVTMGGYFISPFMRVSHTYPVCVWSPSAHRSAVYTLFPCVLPRNPRTSSLLLLVQPSTHLIFMPQLTTTACTVASA